ncbi:MAG: hypothetical protein Nkreftii_003967 [Candidatus Nitrospira kreftii]|uniref:Uncharacterized protein n=1 Tax=Candidatus Nitrospira kreftii TaxID=2652173 RepID=A0A7S8FHY5_9BACT|nr:MAG: hypothetical protein Nkreftii_003967 [Candidatus Nitrospira kreftii]
MERLFQATYNVGLNAGPLADLGRTLPELRQAIDDAKSYVIPKLDLHHFGGESFPGPSNFLCGELQLSPASFYQVIDEQRGQVLGFLVTGVKAQIEDL